MRAVVLNRRDVREVDQLLTIFTRERGKEHLLTRGSKKLLSKNAPHLDRGSMSQVEIVPGKQLSYITKAIPVSVFPRIRESLKHSLLLNYGLLLVNRTVEEHAPAASFFDLLTDWMEALESSAGVDVLFLDYLALQLLKQNGLEPHLYSCVRCETMRDLHGFAPKDGGVVCSSCAGTVRKEGDLVLPCGKGGQRVLELLLGLEPDSAKKLRLTRQQYTVVHRVVYAFLRFHHERRMPDWGLTITKLLT